MTNVSLALIAPKLLPQNVKHTIQFPDTVRDYKLKVYQNRKWQESENKWHPAEAEKKHDSCHRW